MMKTWMRNFFDLMSEIRWLAVVPLLSGAALVVLTMAHTSISIEEIVATGILNLTLAVLSLDNRT